MRHRAFLSYFCRILPTLLMALSLSAQAQNEGVTMDDGKVSLLKSIMLNTTWPDEDQIEGFVVGLYGRDRDLMRVLRRELPGFEVRGRGVTVRLYDSLRAARNAHILVLAPSRNADLAEINNRLLGSQTLIVTDGAEDTSNTMVNFTHPSETRLAFEINRANIVAAGISLSKDMLLFGGTKLDLAAIYEETEAELERARGVAEEQQKLLTDQARTIERQRAEVDAKRKELEALEERLTNIQTVLEISENRLLENTASLAEKESILAEKEAHIEGYSQRIERNLQRLAAQQSAISERERQIAEQNTVLMKQVSTIDRQRYILIGAAAILLLVLTLIVVIFRGYRSKHRLALQLEGKTRELGVANEKLVQVTEAKSLFLSSMSHEIRTPMNGVIGMAELLESTDLTNQQSDYVSLIIKSADTLLGLINDILDFSKIEAGRLDLEEIPFSLREVLGDTLQTLALRANEKGLELTFHIPPTVPDQVVGDPLRLRQVMVNLVGNAIKFTESGEVDVDLCLESADGSAARILFEVRDTGIGISQRQQEKIFQAFGQADSSTTRQFGGTGLGLAISSQLAQMMGGSMEVRSVLGQGSTFYFSADFRLPDEPVAVALQPEELQGLAALVVDDNSTNRMILEELLDSWGMIPHIASGGEQALAELDRAEGEGRQFALALLDVMMPNMDGFALAAKIRQRPAHQATRILMLTSAGRSESEEIRAQLDISRVLLKPVKHRDLQNSITDALGVTSTSPAKSVKQAPADLEPRRILLVEDNSVNQKVAVELLEKRGHSIELARNGAEAVDATARAPFDVVLMDIHMPVMDGLTATRIIREREREEGGGIHVPIVALTAGATVEDRENSLAAGMNDFITKPFRAGELFDVVEGVPAHGLEAQAPLADDSAQPAGDQACLDWDGALRNLEGDEEFLRELSEMFLQQSPELLFAVEEAVRRESSGDLQRAAHALKGSSLVIGGQATAASALALEHLGRDENLAQALSTLRRLQDNLADLRASLQDALEKQEA